MKYDLNQRFYKTLQFQPCAPYRGRLGHYRLDSRMQHQTVTIDVGSNKIAWILFQCSPQQEVQTLNPCDRSTEIYTRAGVNQYMMCRMEDLSLLAILEQWKKNQ